MGPARRQELFKVMGRVTGRFARVELRRPRRREGSVYASIIDMTLRLPIDEVLFDELRTDFLPKAQHSGFRGFQYVLAEQGRAIGILWYEQPEDLDGITRLGANCQDVRGSPPGRWRGRGRGANVGRATVTARCPPARTGRISGRGQQVTVIASRSPGARWPGPVGHTCCPPARERS